MLEKGIAYRKSAVVNWCPSCETVLANEQVIEGRCWRCDSEVVQKEIPSWYLKITAYADRLLEDLEKLKGKWPERVIAQQRNWIGRSEGAEIVFKVEDTDDEIVVFTTRPDTLFGVTFLVLAPEHQLTLKLAEGTPQEEKVKEFVERIKRMPVEERRRVKEKEGVFTGRYAIHPLTGDLIPIWTANYVLAEYGTGAIMAVPAHDERDYEFAQKYGLPIKGL
jgi:leucyl-tRNA synthetase